jgi:hypothetical protein
MSTQKYIKNKFEIAIDESELKAFAYGLGNYHVLDRDYSDHDFGSNWSAIIACQDREEDTPQYIAEMFSILMQEPKGEAEYDVLYRHFWYYHYFSNEKALHFKLPEVLITSIKEDLTHYLASLKAKPDQDNYFTKNIIKGLNIVL